MNLLKVIDNYKTTIAGNFDSTDTTITVATPPTVITSGYLTIFDFDGNQYEKVKFTAVSGNDLTVVRGLSFTTNSDTPVSGNAKALQNGMVVKLTMSENYLNEIIDQLQGTKNLDGVPQLPASRSLSNARDLVDKEYADLISSAGLTTLLVSDNGGITVNVNAGYYSESGVIGYFSGAAAQALTDDSDNYVMLSGGVVSISVSGFDNDKIPLAKITCASGDITSLIDARAFSLSDVTHAQVQAMVGTNGFTPGSSYPFASNPRVDAHVANTAGYLTGGTNAEDAFATWAAITNGSFRITVDGTAYNVDGIDFSGDASMADVATTIQTALRAATGGTETVAWSTDHFVITSSTSDEDSEISVLSQSTGTVGTDISTPTYMDCDATNAVATQGTSQHLNLVILDANGKIDADFLTNLMSVANAATLTNGSNADNLHSHLPQWVEQLVAIPYDTQITSNGVRFDICFDETFDNMYLGVENTTSPKISVLRFKKDASTGNFYYDSAVTVSTAGSSSGIGVTVYDSQLYVIYFDGSAQAMKRYELDLTSAQAITISGGNNGHIYQLTNNGADFYIGDSTTATIKKYTLSGTTLTYVDSRKLSNNVPGSGWGDCVGLSNNGTEFLYVCTGVTTRNSWDDFDNAKVCKKVFAGGFVNAVVMDHSLGYTIFAALYNPADVTEVITVQMDGSIPNTSTPGSEPLIWRAIRLKRFTASEIGL